ncbi:MAG: hypothetical protein SOZ34_04140 [Clostridia bacterium]|nr:hypothetical protein [Clostridia bacterium]
MIYLGFDTSNYTTSVAACSGKEVINIRKILTVKTGERGLRQSDALFQHIKTLPDLYSQLVQRTDIKKAAAAAVSTRPRSVEGSYMPVFLAGEGYAKTIAGTLGIPLLRLSHQDGHIMAGIDSCDAHFLFKKKFISVHLSGGTCEILLTQYTPPGFSCEIIGGTKDISAGQLIDRTGVAMGMSFPCGKELEALALSAKSYEILPSNTDGAYINFSGAETKTLSLIGKKENSSLALGLLKAIAKSLCSAIDFAAENCGVSDVLIVGGVASNSVIKSYLKEKSRLNLFFSSPEMSTDNACGIARLCDLAFSL